MEKLCSKIYIREICELGFEGEIYVMKEKRSTNKILVSISLAFGILSLFSFVLYFYSANHAPYTYIDTIFLGPLFSFIGIEISIIKREFSKLIGFLVVALIAVGLVFNAGGVKDVLLELFNKIIGI